MVNMMSTPRNHEDEPLPLKPQDAYDQGLDTQDEPELEDAYSPTYRDESARNECWRSDD